ncbi:MAG: hypothetical protein EXS37_13700 [Opitutus sp.]|nr:hypothetical protein [Opitutus sp.]
MKKMFSLRVPGKADARVLDAIKHDVRKYVKRERRKPLPEGFGIWRFDCKIGLDEPSAGPKDLKELSKVIDDLAQTETDKIYIEILAAPDHQAAPAVPATAGTEDTG